METVHPESSRFAITCPSTHWQTVELVLRRNPLLKTQKEVFANCIKQYPKQFVCFIGHPDRFAEILLVHNLNQN